jgi:hypothetical protein
MKCAEKFVKIREYIGDIECKLSYNYVIKLTPKVELKLHNIGLTDTTKKIKLSANNIWDDINRIEIEILDNNECNIE